ncbi:cystathionine beta-synthase-like [Diorhabda carinulata]|uniref:cystathionine beta-synthase-like n=1 Tax=Diorhabda carinulata TaxID=1163345 RepID=UPI0025A178BC|nr:cystathionine beta-synthase-like [Diorhabda carinulata]
MSKYVYRSPLNDACCVPNNEQKCPWNSKIDRSTTVHTTKDWNEPRPKILPNALAAIGNTPMIRLNRIPRQEGLECDVYVKCDYLNPGGSVKDRMAHRILEDAEKEGILKPGCTIVEPSSGNTGIGLALAATIKGYRCIIVMSEKISKEKEYVMRALGAEVVRCAVTENSFSPNGMFGTVHRLAKEIPNSVIFDQFSNPGNPLTHYDTTAEEIYDQCDGQVDMIVMGAGTGGTVTGIGRKFKEISPHTHIVCADPYGSSFALPEAINKTDVTFWEIEGMGYEFIPSTLDRKVVDVWIKVGDKDALPMARRLIKEEGLLIGASSGAMMWAAVQAAKAKNLGLGKKVVVVLPDSIRNYLTKFVCDQWMEERNLKPCVNINNHPWWNTHVTDLDFTSVQTIPADASYKTALNTMEKLGVHQLPATNEEHGVVGVITMQIIVNKLTSGKIKLTDPIVDALDRLYPRVNRTANVGLVSRILEKESYVIVLEVHETGTSKMNKFVGVVTALDFTRFLQKNE